MSSPSRRVIRVASIPAGHPYVAHLGLDRVDVRLLADPRPPGAPPGRWWPPVMLDPGWVGAHAARVDLVHLHFGFESLSLTGLGAWLDALEAADRALVHTVHDLEHPQLRDGSHHRAQLDLLIPRASELITLTTGAAEEIARRWGRRAEVIPHPRMLAAPLSAEAAPAAPESTRDRASRPRGAARVAIHLRDLRPNIDGPGSVRGLAGALARLDAAGHDLRGEIHLFTHTRDPAGAREVRTVVTQSPHLDLIEAARRSDAALVAELSGLSASVMPYRHGTHSGWAELCWDLGVPVLGADLGHIADQHDDPGWFTPVDVSDPAALASALAALPPVDPNARARTRTHRAKGRAAVAETIAVAHREVYERALRAV